MLTESLANNHGFLDGNKRIAFTATDVFLRRSGFYIGVAGSEGYMFIDGSVDRHEFRFAQILDWIRMHIQPSFNSSFLLLCPYFFAIVLIFLHLLDIVLVVAIVIIVPIVVGGTKHEPLLTGWTRDICVYGLMVSTRDAVLELVARRGRGRSFALRWQVASFSSGRLLRQTERGFRPRSSANEPQGNLDAAPRPSASCPAKRRQEDEARPTLNSALESDP